MRISRKLGLWRARDVESLVLDNVSTFLLFFCTPLIFAQSFFSWDVVLVMINRGRLRSGYRLLSWGVAASATQVPFTCQSNPLGQGTPLPWDCSVLVWENNLYYSCPWLGRAAQWPCVLLPNSLGMAGNVICPPGVLKEGYGEDAKNNSFVDHHYLLPSLRVSIVKEFRWDKPHLISCGLLQHTALAGQTVAEFIVTFCL